MHGFLRQRVSKENGSNLESIDCIEASRRPMFVCFRTLRLLLSSHKNKIRKAELEEKFTDTLNVIEVVSVVETYQSDENNLTYKR